MLGRIYGYDCSSPRTVSPDAGSYAGLAWNAAVPTPAWSSSIRARLQHMACVMILRGRHHTLS